MRIDLYLVNNNYFDSRTKAQDAIKQGAIYVNNIKVEKSNYDVKDGSNVCVKFETQEFVSRGGYKLKEAINKFNLDFNDKIVLDIGSSTGGFTDCALKHGAKMVYAVDVGSDQLHSSLRNNSRIVSLENTNILDFNTDVKFDYLVMDVSFVSINHLIPALLKFLNNNNKLVCLIKPQFEAGKMINKGIIKDKKLHLKIIKEVNDYLNEAGLYINKITPSPIKGGSGNIEFLCLVSLHKSPSLNYKLCVEEAYKMY
ncbi:MAG: TlyA family RNA methyltransferase [Anaeroplasmataceae bacterium]